MPIRINVCHRNVCNGNEQHDAEIASATVAAEDDAVKSSEDLIHHINSEYLLFLNVFINFTKSLLNKLYNVTII